MGKKKQEGTEGEKKMDKIGLDKVDLGEWNTLKKGHYPLPGKLVELLLSAEYEGYWEPSKDDPEKGTWAMNPPKSNISLWRYKEEPTKIKMVVEDSPEQDVV